MGRKRRNAKHRGSRTAEPYWEPLARQEFSTAQTLAIVARQGLPLMMLWLLSGSLENFLLLCVFNIALDIACIVVVGLAVSTRQVVGDHGAADTIGALVTLVVIGVVTTVVLTALFGWVIALLASESAQGLWNAQLGWSAAALVAIALPGMVRQYREDMAAKRSEDERKRRDHPVVGGHLLSAGLIFILSGQTADWGRVGMIAMALLITALFIFRDLRPDLMRELTRPSNRPPG